MREKAARLHTYDGHHLSVVCFGLCLFQNHCSARDELSVFFTHDLVLVSQDVGQVHLLPLVFLHATWSVLHRRTESVSTFSTFFHGVRPQGADYTIRGCISACGRHLV